MNNANIMYYNVCIEQIAEMLNKSTKDSKIVNQILDEIDVPFLLQSNVDLTNVYKLAKFKLESNNYKEAQNQKDIISKKKESKPILKIKGILDKPIPKKSEEKPILKLKGSKIELKEDYKQQLANIAKLSVPERITEHTINKPKKSKKSEPKAYKVNKKMLKSAKITPKMRKVMIQLADFIDNHHTKRCQSKKGSKFIRLPYDNVPKSFWSCYKQYALKDSKTGNSIQYKDRWKELGISMAKNCMFINESIAPLLRASQL